MAGVFALYYQIYHGIGVWGLNSPVFWALRHHQFRFLDWHQPRRHIDLCDSAPGECHLAASGHALRRSDHRLCGFHRRHHSRLPHWPAVAGVLDVPYPSERGIWPNFRSPLAWDFFAINTYLTGSVSFLFLPMIPDFAMIRDQLHRLPSQVLRGALAGLAGNAEAMASPGNCDAHHGHRDHSRRGIGPHDCLVGLRHDARADVEVHHLRTLLRVRRDLQRHRWRCCWRWPLLRKFLHLEEYLQPCTSRIWASCS